MKKVGILLNYINKYYYYYIIQYLGIAGVEDNTVKRTNNEKEATRTLIELIGVILLTVGIGNVLLYVLLSIILLP